MTTAPPDRAAFLSRIRDALGPRAGPVRAAPAIDDAVVRTVGRDADLPTRFAAAAMAVGMAVHRVGEAELAQRLAELLRTLGVRRVATALCDETLAAAVEAALRADGCGAVGRGPALGFEPHYEADASITGVAAAVAETGSLVIPSGAEAPRAALLVPPVHIAVVRTEQLVADLADYFPMLAGASSLPAAVVLVTGPSKTADIEGILVTGAHGPREVHVVVVG